MRASTQMKKQFNKNNWRKRIHRDMHGSKMPDQIKKSKEKGVELNYDPDMPGNGMFYCVECDRYFREQNALNAHIFTKRHKKSIKENIENIHTQKDAERAAGLY